MQLLLKTHRSLNDFLNEMNDDKIVPTHWNAQNDDSNNTRLFYSFLQPKLQEISLQQLL